MNPQFVIQISFCQLSERYRNASTYFAIIVFCLVQKHFLINLREILDLNFWHKNKENFLMTHFGKNLYACN